MKNILLTLMVFGIVGCATNEKVAFESKSTKSDFNFYEEFNKTSAEERYAELAKMNSLKESASKRRAMRTELLEQEKEKKIKELIERCEEFGFQGDNNIAACIQREVKIDLTLAKQQKKINKLENRIDSLAESQEELNKANSSDWLVDLLSVINDEADRKREMAQTVRIHRLESRVNAQIRSNNTKRAMCVMNSKNC